MNIQSFCSKCGGQLIPQGDNVFKCKFCDSIYREDTVKKEREALSAILDEEKQEKVASLKRELWKKANEEYNDSAEILRICREIKRHIPDDFYVNFYEAANSDNENLFVEELECIDVIEHYDDIEHILNYALKSITPKNMLAICNLIERAYKQNDLSLYNEFRTKYDEQCTMINDCVYDPAYPRDVFVCYSSKDMAKVESLVKFLEEQGLLCFVAIRNLQHGRGAVQNYWNAIHTAIENCKCVVFLSSTNSRDMHCDALQELRYVLALEQKLNKKIKRIEYLLENYTGAHVERNFKRVFEGLEYCYDEETVYDRVMWDDEETVAPTIPEPELTVHKEVKFCQRCGKGNPDNAKFCFDCGNDVFVATQEEYIEHLRRANEELERQKLSLENERQRALEQQAAAPAPVQPASATVIQTPAVQVPSVQIPSVQVPAVQAPINHGVAYNPPVQNSNSNQYEDDYFSGRMKYVDVDVPNNNYTRNNRDKDNTSYYTGSDLTELIKGQHVILPEYMRKLRVTIENEYKLDDVVADLYIFLLDGNERVLSESDLVFFGNPMSLNESVTWQSDYTKETVDITINKINQDICKIRFILSLNMEDGRIRNFSMVRSSTINFYLEDQAFTFKMSDIGRFESVSAFEIYRIRNKWKINIQAAGLKENIATLCGNYGIEVE